MDENSAKDTNGCSYESPTMGRCGAPIGAHYKDSGHGPILYHSFVPPTSTVATKDAEQRGSAEARLVHAIRHADKAFERVGGSTRHYVRDCLIPEMQEQHICVVDADEIECLRGLLVKVRRTAASTGHENYAECKALNAIVNLLKVYGDA